MTLIWVVAKCGGTSVCKANWPMDGLLLHLMMLCADSAAKQVTSARDGTLMQLVGPLLAGNARTFMLAAVSPDADDYLDTVNTLRIATRAQNIQVT